MKRQGAPTTKDRRDAVARLRVLAARTIRMIEERLPEALDKDPEIDKTLKMAEEARDFASWAWGTACAGTGPEPQPGDIVKVTAGPFEGKTGIAGRSRSGPQKLRVYFARATERGHPAHRVISKEHLQLIDDRSGYDPFTGKDSKR